MGDNYINIKKINLEDRKELENVLKIIAEFDLGKEAFFLLKRIKEEKERNGTHFVYGDIIFKLKWIALHLIQDEEVFDLFSSHFLDIFEINDFSIEDVWRRLKIRLLTMFYDERDKYKQKIRKALSQNNELITKQKIIVNGSLVSPTIANWIRDYNINLGMHEVDKEKQIQYLTYSENIKKLNNKEEKEKLRQLFFIYEKLKLSSLTAAGVEEDIYIEKGRDGKEGILSDGFFIEIDEKTKKDIEKIFSVLEEKDNYKENVLKKQNSLFQKALKERKYNNVDSLTLDDKNKLLKKYPPGSLERKALEERILDDFEK